MFHQKIGLFTRKFPVINLIYKYNLKVWERFFSRIIILYLYIFLIELDNHSLTSIPAGFNPTVGGDLGNFELANNGNKKTPDKLPRAL
jgi:hypothetical protein